MLMSDSTDVPNAELETIEYSKRWVLPSFLVRNYQFGYERECHDLLFAGEGRRGAREIEDSEDILSIQD